MAANPKNLAAKIAHFLKNPDNTSFLDFTVGTFHVTPRLYAKVAQRLEKSHAITVEVQALPNNLSGAYDPGANKFYLNPAETADPISLGCTIIHEATHAAADVQKLDLYFVDNEAAGFIAGALFARSKKKSLLGPLGAPADGCAEAILDGRGFQEPLRALRQAIAVDSFYGKKCFVRDGKKVKVRVQHLDGVAAK